MKYNLKKVATVFASALMLGSTVGLALAANYPAPFVSNGAANVAVVVGSASGADDGAAALDIAEDLSSALAGSSGSTVVAGEVKVVDDEVTLGGLITGGDIDTNLKDNKLSTLADGKFSWDDGDGSEEYNYHEEVVIGKSEVYTTLDDKKLEGVALTNENALSYRFVFDESINTSAIGEDDADTLYLEIMGTEYEIEDMSASSITVTTSEQVSVTIGDTLNVEDKVVEIVDIFDGQVEVKVDGKSEVINEDRTKRINGVRVKVESVGYHSNSPDTSKAVIKVGKDISKTYTNGDEYIGQDEDDPLWVWEISSAGSASGYIGVAYNAKIDSANDKIAGDSIKYVGDGYLFPNNYVAVTLDSTTDVSYQDLKIYFEESEDLFNNSDTSSAFAENVPVLVIEAEETDALTTAGVDTDKIFVYYNTTSGKVQTFYSDFDGDYTPTNKMRLANSSITLVANTSVEVATVEVGDTNLDIDLNATALDGTGSVYLQITNDDDSNAQVAKLKIGGTAINATTAGTFERLGATEEEAEAGDVLFQGVDVSVEDYDYMDHYGITLSDGTTVEIEADDDMVTLGIPDEQVYAQVTVSMGAQVSDEDDGPESLGIMTITDTEAAASTKNLIVIGGSCVNSLAADLLGVSAGSCGSASGLVSGQAMIKSFARTGGKVAVLIAGYEKSDTAKAATFAINNDWDASNVDLKLSTATAATTVLS